MINRARQYGKTTTLHALLQYLADEYIVVFMDFQKMGRSAFENESVFSSAFFRHFKKAAKNRFEQCTANVESIFQYLEDADNLNDLFVEFSALCEQVDKPIVLIIDEVDSASNNQVFLDFLSQLRAYYLDRRNAATFHSVILAGVYDIKNLKIKIQSGDELRYNMSTWRGVVEHSASNAEHNSPWNIAEQLVGYLEDYHQDKGYLLSFCFNKDKNIGVTEIEYNGKRILEAVV